MSLNIRLEAVIQTCSVNKVFYKKEISQNSQENASAKVPFLNKVAGLRPATLLKKTLQLYLKRDSGKEHLWWLILFAETIFRKKFVYIVFL